MATRWRVGLLVAVLATTAGCSALPAAEWPAESEPTETLTPAPVGGDGTPTTDTPAPDALPPGVFANGTVDVDRLARAHAGALDGRTYTWRYEQTLVQKPDDVTYRNFTRRVSVVAVSSLIEERGLLVPDSTRYLTARRGYVRKVEDREAPYEILDETHREGQYAPVREIVRTFLDGMMFRVAAVDWNGTRAVRLHVPPGPPPPELFDDDTVIRDYTATAVVTPDGIVRRLNVTYVFAERRRHSSVRFAYVDVGGTAIQRPDWVSRLEESSTPAVETATPAPATGRTGTTGSNVTVTERRSGTPVHATRSET